MPLIEQGGPSDRLAEKIILASLRYFFAKPCTIRAKDKRMHIRKEIPALPKPGMFNHKIKKIMIQTKNKYCKETFIRLNYWYDRIHGLVREDIEKVNAMVEHIEKTRSDWYPRTGDGLFFISGYGERSRPFFVDAVYGDNIVLRNFSRVPFVSRDKKGVKCDMHGGECVLVKAGDVRFKAWTTGRFKHWGHYGACENGEVYYDTKIALWECGAPEQPESREWFKIRIRKNTRPVGDMYTGEISCKDEDGLKQFIDDHEGLIFAEEDSLEMVILCFRHSDMRISPEEWEKMDCPVSVREIYGQMQKVKIVKDHKTHLTTFYY